VELVEMLGAERLVHGKLAGAPFTVRFDSTRVPPTTGDTVALRVAPQHLHWFDPQTRARVE
jgi:sn-glycerol 3-phosphate transport system ATP-binding protein